MKEAEEGCWTREVEALGPGLGYQCWKVLGSDVGEGRLGGQRYHADASRPSEARELTLAALGVAFPLLCCPI